MSDTSMPEPSSSPELALTSEQYADVLEVLEVLYIKGNMSARIRLFQEWPVLADYILGAELIGFDTDGTDDLDRRVELEKEAEERRFTFVETLKGIEASSVDDGVLQLEYVQGLVKGWGRELASLVYAPRIVDKVLGPSAPPVVEAATEVQVEKSEPAAPDFSGDIDESQYVSNAPEAPKTDEALPTPADMKISEKLVGPGVDAMPDVKPIDMEPPKDVKPIDADEIKSVEIAESEVVPKPEDGEAS